MGMTLEAMRRNQKRPEAVKMLLSGKDVEDVAKAVNVDVLYIKRWATKTRVSINSARPETKFVYALKDPTDGLIRYVGACDNPGKRYCEQVYHEKSTNSAFRKWMTEIRSQDLLPYMIILRKIHSKNWRDVERFWIEKMLAAGHPLLNRHWRP